MKLGLKHYLLAGTMLAGGAFVSAPANASVCPTDIGSSGGCNIVITAGPGGSFSTQVLNANPYDGSDDNLVGIINNSGATITQLSFSGAATVPTCSGLMVTACNTTDQRTGEHLTPLGTAARFRAPRIST